jgi:hypothetical protein
MSDCIHCDIHDLLESHLQSDEANLVEITAKVTEVLADLISACSPCRTLDADGRDPRHPRWARLAKRRRCYDPV